MITEKSKNRQLDLLEEIGNTDGFDRSSASTDHHHDLPDISWKVKAVILFTMLIMPGIYIFEDESVPINHVCMYSWLSFHGSNTRYIKDNLERCKVNFLIYPSHTVF